MSSVRQPMGGSGIDLEIMSGQPRQPKTLKDHRAEEGLKDAKVLKEAVQLSQELPLVLPMMAGQLEKRVMELMAKDPLCLSILRMVAQFKLKLDLSKHVAAKIRRQAMGIVLDSMTDETKVAPEDGIPTEE
jgi:hypothetical protein